MTEFLIYYTNKHVEPPINRPTAVLFGNDWQPVPEYPLNFENQFGFFSTFLNHKAEPFLTDATKVKHSKDLLIIQPMGDLQVYIQCEKGDGFRIGSESMIQIAGVLQIKRNDGSFETLDGGRHTIKSNSNDIMFVILDKGKVLMICSDNRFIIDEESSFHGELSSRRGSGGGGGGGGGGPFTSTPITESIFRLQTQSKDPSESPIKNTKEEVADETQDQILSEFSSINFSIPKGRITDFVIYYKKPSVLRLTGILVGNDWTSIKHQKVFGCDGGEGWLSVFLNNDPERFGSDVFIRSKDLIHVYPTRDSYIYIHGENGDGLRVGPKSYIMMNGKLKIYNGANLQEGRHTIIPTDGDMTIVFCDNNIIRILASNFVVDGEPYMGVSGDIASDSHHSHDERWTREKDSFWNRQNSEFGAINGYRGQKGMVMTGFGRGRSRGKMLQQTANAQDYGMTTSEQRTNISSPNKGRGRARRSQPFNLQGGAASKLGLSANSVVSMGNETLENLQDSKKSMTKAFNEFEEYRETGLDGASGESADSSHSTRPEVLKDMIARKTEQNIGSYAVSSQLPIPTPRIQKFSDLKKLPKDYPTSVEYLLYCCEPNGSIHPIGDIFGNLYGQTNNTKILKLIPKSERSTIRVILFNKDDTDMVKDKKSIGVGDLVDIKSLNGAKIFLYDEQCDGIVLGFGSKLKLSARPFKLANERQIPLNPINIENELMASKVGDSFHFVFTDHKLICFQGI